MSLTYPSDQMSNHAGANNPTFLGTVDARILNAISDLQRSAQRLYEAGFYGPPESASKADAPTENNPRSLIIEHLETLAQVVNQLDTQIARIA